MFSLFLWSLCLGGGAAMEAHQPVFNCPIKAQFSSARSLLVSVHICTQHSCLTLKTQKSNLFFPLSLNGKDCNFKFFCNFLGSHLNMEIASNQNYICFPGKREKAALSAHSTWDCPVVIPILLCILKPFASYSPFNRKIFLF